MGWWLKLVEETSSFAAANVETRRLPDSVSLSKKALDGMFVSPAGNLVRGCRLLAASWQPVVSRNQQLADDASTEGAATFRKAGDDARRRLFASGEVTSSTQLVAIRYQLRKVERFRYLRLSS